MSKFEFTTKELQIAPPITIQFEATPFREGNFFEPDEPSDISILSLKLFDKEIPPELEEWIMKEHDEELLILCQEWLPDHIAEENQARAEAQYDFLKEEGRI